METTKNFRVIFNDNLNTIIETNNLEKSELFKRLSKKYTYSIIELKKATNNTLMSL